MKSYKGKFKRTQVEFIWDTEIDMYRVCYMTYKKYEVQGYINDIELDDFWEFLSKGKSQLMVMTTDEIEISDIQYNIWERNRIPKWKTR